MTFALIFRIFNSSLLTEFNAHVLFFFPNIDDNIVDNIDDNIDDMLAQNAVCMHQSTRTF